jgi:hypothetical protein
MWIRVISVGITFKSGSCNRSTIATAGFPELARLKRLRKRGGTSGGCLPQEGYQMMFRKKSYGSLEKLRQDVDRWL